MAQFEAVIITPQGSAAFPARSVVMPGLGGETGVRSGHAPLVAVLKTGPLLIYRPDGHRDVFALEGGVAEVSADRVTIATHGYVPAAEIRVDEAARQAEQAIVRLSGAPDRAAHAGALTELDRALVQLRISGEDRVWEQGMRKRRKFVRDAVRFPR